MIKKSYFKSFYQKYQSCFYNIKAAFKLLMANTKNIKLIKIIVSKKINDNIVFNLKINIAKFHL